MLNILMKLLYLTGEYFGEKLRFSFAVPLIIIASEHFSQIIRGY